jgi:glutamate-1-semialdehyde 2,1-aminomutase
MPVGAYLGPAALMDQVAPLGPVYQAGTLSGNPVAMAAGLATLRELERPGTYERLEATGAALEAGLTAALRRHGVAGGVTRVGSILWTWLQAGPAPRRYDAVDPAGARRYGALHGRMMERGVWMAHSAYEVAYVSTAHEPEHLERVLAAFVESLAAVGAAAG